MLPLSEGWPELFPESIAACCSPRVLKQRQKSRVCSNIVSFCLKATAADEYYCIFIRLLHHTLKHRDNPMFFKYCLLHINTNHPWTYSVFLPVKLLKYQQCFKIVFSAYLVLVLWVSLDCSRSALKKNFRSFTGISITVIRTQKIFSLGYINYQMFILSLLYWCCPHIFQLSSYMDITVIANQKWMKSYMWWTEMLHWKELLLNY